MADSQAQTKQRASAVEPRETLGRLGEPDIANRETPSCAPWERDHPINLRLLDGAGRHLDVRHGQALPKPAAVSPVTLSATAEGGGAGGHRFSADPSSLDKTHYHANSGPLSRATTRSSAAPMGEDGTFTGGP